MFPFVYCIKLRKKGNMEDFLLICFLFITLHNTQVHTQRTVSYIPTLCHLTWLALCHMVRTSQCVVIFTQCLKHNWMYESKAMWQQSQVSKCAVSPRNAGSNLWCPFRQGLACVAAPSLQAWFCARSNHPVVCMPPQCVVLGSFLKHPSSSSRLLCVLKYSVFYCAYKVFSNHVKLITAKAWNVSLLSLAWKFVFSLYLEYTVLGCLSFKSVGETQQWRALFRGPKFESQHLHGISQLSATPVPGDSVPCSGPCRHFLPVVYRHTCRQAPSYI